MITLDDKPIRWQPGITLDHVMASLEDGEIYAVVRLNGKPVCRPHFHTTFVSDCSIIETIPLIAGG